MTGVLERRAETTDAPPRHFTFLVVPHFNMMSFTTAIKPLRSANFLSERPLYSWLVGALDTSPVPASNGITVLPDCELASLPPTDAVFICASFDVQDFRDRSFFAYLRRADRDGAVLGGIGAGALLLARAGLLAGYRSTIHWENRPAFIEEFPHLHITSHLYEIDRRRVTSCGGASVLDMMLHIVAQDHGGELAFAVAGQLLHDRIKARLSPHIARAIVAMESNVETPLTIPEIADSVGLVQRQLERLFRKHCGQTPYQYYLAIRLHHARALLLETDLSVLNVALASGFSSQTHFTDRFRQAHGMTPSVLRRHLHDDTDEL